MTDRERKATAIEPENMTDAKADAETNDNADSSAVNKKAAKAVAADNDKADSPAISKKAAKAVAADNDKADSPAVSKKAAKAVAADNDKADPVADNDGPVADKKTASKKTAAPKIKAAAKTTAKKAPAKTKAKTTPALPYQPRLHRLYVEELRAKLMQEHGYSNVMQIPALDKIVLNMGVGEASRDSKKLVQAVDHLSLIAGQRAVKTYARKAIATYKIREGMPIGARVTLRHQRMYEFLDRLVTIALPRVRDFRGLNPASFDGLGNFALGIREHIVFPEIDYSSVEEIRGLDIVIATTATTDAEGLSLLRSFNLPFNTELS